MKTRHIILCAICVAAVALVTLFLCVLKKHNDEIIKIEKIPDICLITIEGKEISLTELNPERKTAIMFFSHDCEFCRKEVEGIIANRDSFDGITWVFVTLSPREELDLFLHEYPLDLIPEAKVCIEDWPDLFIALDVTAPPSLFIYDSEGNLENHKRGAVSINTILEWLK